MTDQESVQRRTSIGKKCYLRLFARLSPTHTKSTRSILPLRSASPAVIGVSLRRIFPVGRGKNLFLRQTLPWSLWHTLKMPSTECAPPTQSFSPKLGWSQLLSRGMPSLVGNTMQVNGSYPCPSDGHLAFAGPCPSPADNDRNWLGSVPPIAASPTTDQFVGPARGSDI